MVTTRHFLVPTYRAMTVVGAVLTIDDEGNAEVILCTDTTAQVLYNVHYTVVPKVAGRTR